MRGAGHFETRLLVDKGANEMGFLERIGADVRSRVFANLQDLQLRSVGQRYRIYQLVNGLMESHRKGRMPLSNRRVWLSLGQHYTRWVTRPSLEWWTLLAARRILRT